MTAANIQTMDIHVKSYSQNLEISVSKELQECKVKLLQPCWHLKQKIHTRNGVKL